MRVPTVALYTLAALASSDLTKAAIAIPSPSLLNDSADTTAPANTKGEISEPIVAIAPPEASSTPLSDTSSVVSVAAPSTAESQLAFPKIDNVTEVAPPEALSVPERSPRAASVDTVIARVATDRVAVVTQAIVPEIALLTTQLAEPQIAETDITEIETPETTIASVTPRAIASPTVTEGAPSTSAALLLSPTLLAQATTPSEAEIEELRGQLRLLEPNLSDDFGNELQGSPAVTISNPSGFGADNFTGFVNFGFQAETRYSNQADGTMGIGIGLGDAERAVGLQLSYTLASFGENRDFGTGGFNAKLHREFGNGLGVAVGWEGFITTGEVDFEDTVYGSITQIIRTNDDLDDAFSRVALTAGVGNGRFRSEDDVTNDEDGVNVFGSVAVRVARPVSAIVEWTGQDLAAGLSITPIRGVPWVITPALRDITGAGDGARFVLGTGFSFQF